MNLGCEGAGFDCTIGLIRSAMNSLCFLQLLFSQTAFRDRRALCSFLPWILGPLIRTMFPDQGQVPSVTCKARLYQFLQHLFDNADIVVDAPSQCNNVSIPGDVCAGYAFGSALVAVGMYFFLIYCINIFCS